MDALNDALNNDYLPAFPSTEAMEFVFDDPVPESMEEKRANADNLANGGALTPTHLAATIPAQVIRKHATSAVYMTVG